MLAEVIAIGDELTSGERLDTNSQWLSQRLTQLGVEVRYHSTVGDDLDANIAVFCAAIARAEVVVCTGGIGPTADDLTREAMARAVGVDLVRDPASLDYIRCMFQSRGRPMPESNARQADFPRGGKPILNPHGTAPGVMMVVDRDGKPACRLFALPGVPAEMHEMWHATVGPAIAAAQPEPRVTCHRQLKCFGVGESALEEMLPDMIRRGRQPRVGITVSGATITLRITAHAADETAAVASMAPTIELIREKLGLLVFGEEEEELQHVVALLLSERGQTLATVESWTGGLLAQWLGALEESIDILVSAEVVGQKAVGSPAVTDLASKARTDNNADYGLAVGHPDGGDQECIAIALAGPEGVRVKQYATAGHPSIVRPRAAKQALNLLRHYLLNHEET